MTNPDQNSHTTEEAVRDRLTRLSEASLRINESLDLDTVLQEALDSARSLTSARYGLMITLDDSGRVDDLLASGLTAEQHRSVWEMSEGLRFFEYLSSLPGPLRVRDFGGHARTMGLPDFRPPAPVSSFLTTPIRHRGASVGNLYLANSEPGQEFSREDEETLVMFASQAALVIANARIHRDERRARSRLETLISTSPVGVVVFDARTGRAVSINREGRRIVEGLHEPDVSVERFLETLSFRRADGRELPLDEFPLAQALSTGETVRAEEIVIQSPDGRSVTTLINATPIRAESGEVETVVVTVQDMTPLDDMERLRAEFLAMVSHGLRAPLSAIRGSAATVLGALADLDPAETRQYLKIIEGQADHMRVLIGDLLDVARIETGALPIDPEPADATALVDRARSVFRSAGGENTLEFDLEPDLPLVMADRRRVVQVLGNLLSNAARHSPDPSAIRVAAERRGVDVAFSVADRGGGIPAERLPHLFAKFSRAPGDRERHTAGAGLGLAICKGIVEAHGGRIWADSEGLDRGAVFTFTIPAVEETAAALPRLSVGYRERAGAGKRILVVDDDPQTLRQVHGALLEAGFEPVVTSEPEEALALVKEGRTRLVLLDLVLPDYDGIDLLNDILQIADLPVIFISVYGRNQLIERAFEAGASDYIVKPFSTTELVARIRAALRRRSESYRPDNIAPYALGDLVIDYNQHLVTVAGRPVKLTLKEFSLLFELSVHAGRVVTHERLMQRVWGRKIEAKPEGLRTLRTHLARLRRKLGDSAENPTYIFAEPRVGYRMAKAESEEKPAP